MALWKNQNFGSPHMTERGEGLAAARIIADVYSRSPPRRRSFHGPAPAKPAGCSAAPLWVTWRAASIVSADPPFPVRARSGGGGGGTADHAGKCWRCFEIRWFGWLGWRWRWGTATVGAGITGTGTALITARSTAVWSGCLGTGFMSQ